jgi:hypothetical protein
MAINRYIRISLVLVAVSFAATILPSSPVWAAAGGPKKTYKKAEKRHVSTAARRIKEINGRYVAQNKPQNVVSTPATVCFGRWEQSLNGPVYVSWCPATPNSGTAGQTGGWATPAGTSGVQTGKAPMAGGYAPQAPPANVVNPPPSVCYSGCVPYWTGPAYSWCQPATASSGSSVQPSGWAAPAQAYGSQRATQQPRGYVPPAQQPNVSQPATACNFWSWLPWWGSASAGKARSATACY